MAQPTNKTRTSLLLGVLLAILLLPVLAQAATVEWTRGNWTVTADAYGASNYPNNTNDRLYWNGATNIWQTTSGTVHQLRFNASDGNVKRVDSYTILEYNGGGYTVYNWTLVCSNDTTTWYTLQVGNNSVAAVSNATANITRTLPSPAFCKVYQINFTNSQATTTIEEVFFYYDDSGAPPATTNITFLNRTPSDLTSTALFTSNATYTYQYNITGLVVPFLSYYLNSSLFNCTFIQNGTCQRTNGTSYVITGSNTTVNITYTVGENSVYPSIQNANTTVASSNVINLTSSNQYFADYYNNISTSNSYGFYELQLNSTGSVTVYYFNSSYDFNSNPDLNPNVHLLCSLNGSNINHTHSATNWDALCPFVVNSTGFIDTTKVSSNGGFLIRGNAPGVLLYGYAGAVRTNVSLLSTNSGTSWTPSDVTLRTHLHQFGLNDSFCWAGKGNYTTGSNPQSNGTICDTIEVTPLPPTPPGITSPNSSRYTLSMNITYDASIPYGNSANISFYNITLHNNDSTFNRTIRTNNSLNTSFLWTFYQENLTENMQYRVRVTVKDTLGQLSYDESEPFTVYGNSRVNITFRNKFTNQYVNNSFGWYYDTVTGENFTFNSSGTNISQVAMWMNRNYTIYAENPSYSISSDNFKYNYSTTKNNDNYSFYVYSNNSIIANIFDQSTGALITLNFTVNLLSDNYTFTNYTTTGTYYIDNVQDGTYTLRFSNTNYTSTSYFVTVADRSTQVVNAYLTANTSQVVIRVLKAESLEPIEGATVSQYRAVNGSNVIIESRATDVSGRAVFGYIADQRYGFVVQKTDYDSTSFTLDPVLFSSYDVQLELSAGASSTQIPLSDVGVEFSPNTYYSTIPNVFRITFTSANGEFSYYNVSINHTKYNFTGGGVNAGGGTINTTFNLTGAAKNEYIFIHYCYKKVGFEEVCFTYPFEVIGNYSVGTWVNTEIDGYGMQIGDKTIVATFVIIVGASIGMMVAGVSGGAVFGLLLMWMFALIAFIPWWSAVVGTIASFLLLARMGGSR